MILIEKHLNAVSSIVVNKVIKMVKRQVCFTIEEEVVKKMEDIRDTTGVPVSKQIELALKGYKIEKVEQR